jgi:hypothetical protein
MSIEWGPATKASAERLAAAIREVATENHHYGLAQRAADGEFTDYADTHVCPITELHRLCREYGLHELADRVANGDFDAGPEESDEWAASPSGQSAMKELSALGFPKQ